MASIFTKIINRVIPAYIVAESEHCIAFLDIRPLQKGHTLVVPKLEVDKLFDLPEDIYRELWLFARQVSLALEKSVECNRIGITVYGLEVPHAHIHLIPIKREGDMDFRNPMSGVDERFFETITTSIKQNLD